MSRVCSDHGMHGELCNALCSSAGVTAIEPGSLAEVAKPLCTWSGPLLEPPTSYSSNADAVQCWQHVTFGKHAWPLPPVVSTHDSAETRTAVFATALLEGKVLPIFQGKFPYQISNSQACWS